MCLDKIVQNINEFHKVIHYLKEVSPIYPNIYYLEKENTLWATTLIHFERGGITYSRHHVESIRLDWCIDINGDRIMMVERLINNAELCIKYGIPMQFSNIVDRDGKQIVDDIVNKE